jgi:hypothetical protein
LLRKMGRQSERLEKKKEKRESLREVREEEYWSVEKVTDGSAFAYEQQQLREEREHKSNTDRRGRNLAGFNNGSGNWGGKSGASDSQITADSEL